MQILLNIFIVDLDNGMEGALTFVNDSEMVRGGRQSIDWAICRTSIQRDLS